MQELSRPAIDGLGMLSIAMSVTGTILALISLHSYLTKAGASFTGMRFLGIGMGLMISGVAIVSIQEREARLDATRTFGPGPSVKVERRTEFCFWHPTPPTGIRRMKRHEETWIETLPDGRQLLHKVLGRVTAGPLTGDLTVRLEAPVEGPYPVQLFIPDEGTLGALLYRPTREVAWEAAGTIEDCGSVHGEVPDVEDSSAAVTP